LALPQVHGKRSRRQPVYARQSHRAEGYEIANSDVVALLSEYGMIGAVAAILYLALGLKS
jgi:hypothetical protein